MAILGSPLAIAAAAAVAYVLLKPAASNPVRITSRKFFPVLETMYVTSKYGPRWGKFHQGMDLRAAIGTPVFAPEDAEVSAIKPDSKTGGLIVYLAGLECTWAFLHLSESLVSVGDRIKEGQIFAKTGNSGINSLTGEQVSPHLHLEAGAYGVMLDPQPLFEESAYS